jgi:hypothetical protein
MLLTEAGHIELKKGEQHVLLTHDILEIDGFKRKNLAKFPEGPRYGYRLVEIAAANYHQAAPGAEGGALPAAAADATPLEPAAATVGDGGTTVQQQQQQQQEGAPWE